LTRRRPRIAPALATILIATAAGLLIAEGVVRLFAFDWRLIRRLLYYQTVDLASHQADPDPLLLYRLRPGRTEYPRYTVTINSLGLRGPERSVAKPPGVTRVLCVGASNVYGLELNDDQTWPARLEQRLNRDAPGRYEVWNLGVPGYVGVQMAIVGEDAVARYDPDLVLVGLSNVAARPFLEGAPVEPYFERDPRLWTVLFPADYLTFPGILTYGSRIGLFRHVRLYRLGILAAKAARHRERNWKAAGDYHEDLNLARTRAFLWRTREKTPVAVFICPSEGCRARSLPEYLRGLDLPVIDLRADGRPEAYANIHPPAPVMVWYAEEIARALRANGLLPPEKK
jgi:hypothetical protein